MPIQSVPVHEGQLLDVAIEAVGEKGDGIARHKGFVIFVSNTKKGDQVRVKITKVLQKVSFAEVQGPAEKPVEREHAPVQAPEPEEEFDTSKDSEDFGED